MASQLHASLLCRVRRWITGCHKMEMIKLMITEGDKRTQKKLILIQYVDMQNSKYVDSIAKVK